MQATGNDWINLIVKFSSSCKTCGKRISKGELALWSKSSKAIKQLNAIQEIYQIHHMFQLILSS